MDLQLQGRRVLITGASTGIGLATARSLLAEGASVAIAGRSIERLRAARAKLGTDDDVTLVELDISDGDRVTEMIRKLAAEGGLYGLVNSAGGALPLPYEELTQQRWAEALQQKLIGYVNCCRAALEVMAPAGTGRIVNIVGTAGREPNPWSITTAAVNAALLNFTKTFSRVAARSQVLVNAINPGPTATDRWAELTQRYPERAQAVVDQIPLGRIGQPQDIATVATFLCSPVLSFVTGAAITVDGGKGLSVSY